MITVDEYEHTFIALSYTNNKPHLIDAGGYWMSEVYILNDYRVVA